MVQKREIKGINRNKRKEQGKRERGIIKKFEKKEKKRQMYKKEKRIW